MGKSVATFLMLLTLTFASSAYGDTSKTLSDDTIKKQDSCEGHCQKARQKMIDEKGSSKRADIEYDVCKKICDKIEEQGH